MIVLGYSLLSLSVFLFKIFISKISLLLPSNLLVNVLLCISKCDFQNQTVFYPFYILPFLLLSTLTGIIQISLLEKKIYIYKEKLIYLIPLLIIKCILLRVQTRETQEKYSRICKAGVK